MFKSTNNLEESQIDISTDFINTYVDTMAQRLTYGSKEFLEQQRKDLSVERFLKTASDQAKLSGWKTVSITNVDYVIPNDRIAITTGGFVLSGSMESSRYSVPDVFTNSSSEKLSAHRKAWGENFYSSVVAKFSICNPQSLFSESVSVCMKCDRSTKKGRDRTDTEIAIVKKDFVREYYEANADFRQTVNQTISERLNFANEKMRLAKVGGFVGMVAIICESFSHPSTVEYVWDKDGKICIYINVINMKLGLLTFISREMVGRNLQALEKAGLLERKKTGFILRQIEI